MQKVKALHKQAEEKFPLLKDAHGKDGTAVIKKKIMMLFINAAKREPRCLHCDSTALVDLRAPCNVHSMYSASGSLLVIYNFHSN